MNRTVMISKETADKVRLAIKYIEGTKFITPDRYNGILEANLKVSKSKKKKIPPAFPLDIPGPNLRESSQPNRLFRQKDSL